MKTLLHLVGYVHLKTIIQ